MTTVTALLTALMLVASSGTASAQGPPPGTPERTQDRAPGRSRVIVELRVPALVPEARLPDAVAVGLQRRAIAEGSGRVTASLSPAAHRVVRRYATVPYLALDVTAEARASLDAHDDVVRVFDDRLLFPVLDASVPLVEGDQAWAGGFDGSGTTIAVLDTGVDAAHPMLAGKVVEEACFSRAEAGLSESLCPNGQDEQSGPGAAAPCALTNCFHGTHVAGIAAGHDPDAIPATAGVARGADIFAVQVFTRVVDPESCGGAAPCIAAFTSDVIAGLERVYSVALGGAYAIAAVNLSLGGDVFTEPCDAEPYKPAIDNLRAIGIATVVAAGNSGIPFGIATPACISSAVSVGATTDADTVSWFSNAASFLSLFAPGDSIVSAVTGGGYAALSGTSMAAPHVAGAWSVLRQAAPGASVATILERLRDTGVTIHDSRLFGGTAVVPRLRIFRALASLVPTTNPAPSIAATNPASARAGSAALTLVVSGSGFNTFSVVRWNGADRPTRVVGTTALEAVVAAADLAAEGTAQVSVHTPGPGGGTSGALAFTIDPPPAISVSASLVAPGSTVTALLVRAIGGGTDYLTLAATGAADSSYLKWTYVGGGNTEKTWTVTMPTAAGSYEFRLYAGGVRRATSPPVTVDPSANPTPVVSGLSPSFAVAGGPAFTLIVTGSTLTAASVVRWNGAARPTTVVSTGELHAAIGAVDIASAATVEITVSSPAPGGGVSAPLAFMVRPAPTLAVSATTVPGGAPVTATLNHGFGGVGDWIALAASGAPNGSYVKYTSVGTGVTDRTWTPTMPIVPGSYEFRLFTSAGTRLATSPVVVVTGPALTVDVASAAPGASVTMTLTNGSGGAGDWLALAETSSADNQYVKYTYVGTGITSRTWTVTMPATPGAYEFRMYASNGYARLATSAPITVDAGAPALTSLSPSTAAAGGAAFTLNVHGSGFAADSIVRWNGADRVTTFVSASHLQAAIPATDIAAAGAAQVTVFSTAKGSSTALPFTVGGAPALTVSSTSIVAGAQVTVTLTGGSGSSTDWLAIAEVGSVNSRYLQYTYVGAGVTTRTWTVAIAAPGTYEFRLFRSGYTRVATSVPIVVEAGTPPQLTVSETTAARGTPVTVTLTNGRGGASDWLSFASTTSSNTNYVQWVYVGSNVTTRTWTVTMPSTPGTYEFRLFLNNGYTRAATSPAVTVP